MYLVFKTVTTKVVKVVIKVVNGKQYNLVPTLAKALFVVNTPNNLCNNLLVDVVVHLVEDAVVHLVEDHLVEDHLVVVLIVMPLHVMPLHVEQETVLKI
jgi:hypothetical protein